MPNNATVLDFAFSIHTFLGAHCFGAKVNHKLVPLNYRLKSGDQVEILTSNTQHAQAEWLNFATTAKARGKIQAILRHEKREVIKEGEAKLKAFLKKAGLELSTSNLDKLTSSRGYMNKDEFLYAIGNEKLSLSVNYHKNKKPNTT